MLGARRTGFGTLAAMIAAAAMLLAAGLAIFAERRLSRLVLGGLGESFSTRVYYAPAAVGPVSCPPPQRLIARLKLLGYSPAAEAPAAPGQYLWAAPELRVFLRGFRAPMAAQEGGLYALDWDGRRWSVRSSTGPVAQIFLEPGVAGELSGPLRVRREPAAEGEIPPLLKAAVISAEDKRFYRHWGIDLRAALRALWRDVSGRGTLQGGSTITQQLSKNLFLSPRRTMRRKLAEAALAVYLETRYGKERILTLYLNHIYLGQEGAVSVAGVKAAARFYFEKELKDLTLAQSALLAGLVRSPHRYNPFREPAAARERRDFVLRRMLEDGAISEVERRQASAEPLGVVPRLRRAAPGRDNDYYVAEVVRELLPRYGEEALFRQGLSIYTAMDPLAQSAAQRAVASSRAQAALAALDPETGKVLALSGGKDFGESQFNRATQARRQPGSAFKPFVYGAALESGLTAATRLLDEPRSYPRPDTALGWDPRNYDGVYMGTVTARQALAHSLNAATLDLAGRVGVERIVGFARRLGIQSPVEKSLAAVLGASEVGLLELSAAYAPFDNGGFRVEPRLILAVADAEGSALETEGVERSQAVSPALAYLMTTLLEGVVSEGTASSLSSYGWTRPAAGKTGTTNDGRDAWFIGYTPELLAGVWVGDDRRRPIHATGARDAVPIWAEFMKSAAQDSPADDFSRPAGLVEEAIDPVSGLKAVAGCPERRRELFLEGTEPAVDCPLHAPGIKGFFKRLFARFSRR